MNTERRPLTAEEVLKRTVWRSTTSLSASTERFTNWTLASVAGASALLITNLDSVSAIVATTWIKTSMACLGISLLTGVASRLSGLGVLASLHVIEHVESVFDTENGRDILNRVTVSKRQLMSEVASPFLWPFSQVAQESGARGLDDLLSGDKQLIRMMCVQMHLCIAHQLSAVAALLALALGM